MGISDAHQHQTAVLLFPLHSAKTGVPSSIQETGADLSRPRYGDGSRTFDGHPRGKRRIRHLRRDILYRHHVFAFVRRTGKHPTAVSTGAKLRVIVFMGFATYLDLTRTTVVTCNG